MFDLIFENQLVHYNDVQGFEYYKDDKTIRFELSGGNYIIIDDKNKKIFNAILLFKKLASRLQLLGFEIRDWILYLEFIDPKKIDKQYNLLKEMLNILKEKEKEAGELIKYLTTKEEEEIKEADKNNDLELIEKMVERALNRCKKEKGGDVTNERKKLKSHIIPKSVIKNYLFHKMNKYKIKFRIVKYDLRVPSKEILSKIKKFDHIENIKRKEKYEINNKNDVETFLGCDENFYSNIRLDSELTDSNLVIEKFLFIKINSSNRCDFINKMEMEWSKLENDYSILQRNIFEKGDFNEETKKLIIGNQQLIINFLILLLFRGSYLNSPLVFFIHINAKKENVTKEIVKKITNNLKIDDLVLASSPIEIWTNSEKMLRKCNDMKKSLKDDLNFNIDEFKIIYFNHSDKDFEIIYDNPFSIFRNQKYEIISIIFLFTGLKDVKVMLIKDGWTYKIDNGWIIFYKDEKAINDRFISEKTIGDALNSNGRELWLYNNRTFFMGKIYYFLEEKNFRFMASFEKWIEEVLFKNEKELWDKHIHRSFEKIKTDEKERFYFLWKKRDE